MKKLFPFLFITIVVVIFFWRFFVSGLFPVPSDTIIGLYHPFRDLYAKEYPNGIPFKNFLVTDPVRQQYPWRELAISIAKKFEIPLWNPYNFSGTPLLANFQSAVFYPFNLLFFLLPFHLGWSVLIFLQPFLGGVFLYLYLRNLSMHPLASFLGSIVFAFCGFSVAWMEWGTILHVAIWLPLILLSIDRIFFNLRDENSKLKTQNSKLQLKNKKLLTWSLIFIFSLVSSFFAGHLQIFFYLFIVSIAYFLTRWIQFGKNRSILLLYLILATLFLILTSIQWTPTLQLISLSGRDIDQIALNNPGWFIPWQNLIQFVAPDFFGNPATLNYWGIWNYGEFVGYVGIAPLIMAIFALFFRHDRKTFFFGTIFFASLIFSLPTFFAKLPYVLNTPFLSTTQPTRLLFITDFSLAVLAALGLDFFIRNKKRSIIYPLIFLAIVFSGLLIFVFYGDVLIHSMVPENLLVAKRNLYLPIATFSLVIGIIFTSLINKKILQLILLSVLIVAIYFIYKQSSIKEIVILIVLLVPLISLIKNFKRNTVTATLLLMSIIILDLLHFNTKFTPFTNQRYLFPQTKVTSFLQKNIGYYRFMTSDSRILPPNFSAIYKLQSVDGYDPLYLRRYGEFIAASERGEPNISPPFGFNRIITPHNYDSKMIDLLGVKYVLSLSDLPSIKLKKVFQEGQTRVYENMDVFPRVFFAESIYYATDKSEAIKIMLGNDLDIKETVIIEEEHPFTDKGVLDLRVGEANVLKYSENKVVIKTNNSGDGLLILTDTFYPTWRAKINNIETKIYRTDYNFRGIIVPRGSHTITFYNSLL